MDTRSVELLRDMARWLVRVVIGHGLEAQETPHWSLESAQVSFDDESSLPIPFYYWTQ